MRRAFPPALAGLLLVLAAPATADVVVTTLDGEEAVRGISLTADVRAVAVQTAAGPVVQIPTADVVDIVTVPPPASFPPATHPFELELADGSRLRGVLRGPEPGDQEEFVVVRSPVLGEEEGGVRVPIERILAVRRSDETKVPGASRLVRIPGKDAAYRLSGARVEGLLARFTPTGIEMDRGDLGLAPVAYRDLAALFIDNPAVDRLEGLHVVARLSDGSALVLDKGFRIAGGQLRGETPTGVAVRIPAARIAALGFRGGRFVHLSDREPETVEREPFFPLPEGPSREAMLEFVCPVRMDESPDGNPITLGGHRYFKGIGARPTTRLSYALDGRFSTFQAVCGIDDEVLGPGYGHGAGNGSVVFRVQVDGETVHETEPVTGGAEPVRVRVALPRTAKTLTLVVAPVPQEKMPKGVPDSPELDNAVWARPLLIR